MTKRGRAEQSTIDEMRERIAEVAAYAAKHGFTKVKAARALGYTQGHMDHCRQRVKEHDADQAMLAKLRGEG
ncbi:MAG: hypothetical protein V4750_02650 [Pseudomonadota bacterium]